MGRETRFGEALLGACGMPAPGYTLVVRRQGPLTIVHITVAALLMVVVNAQLTWWIVYALRENRTRLKLERGHLLSSGDDVAARIAASLDGARAKALATLTAGATPEHDPAPAPFVSWRTAGEPTERGYGWQLQDDRLVLTLARPGGCVVAVAEGAWTGRLLHVPTELEVVAAAAPQGESTGSVSGTPLPPPFSDRQVRPDPAVWAGILHDYRGRIVMMVAEGSTFAVLLLAIMGLFAKTLRREAELERQHRNFLAAITHELKSPLAAMRLSLETVLRGRADHGASVRFLENALQDTERLQSLVQKVLEVTRYTGTVGGLKLRRSCLSEVVEDCLATFQRLASAAGADLEVEVTPGVWADLDDEAFAIVVSNLLENAVKYGGTIPRVSVNLSVVDGRACLEVADNGRGIAAQDLPFIFNRFFRGGDEMTRTTQGTGLGLYLVQQIVSGHRGTVEVAATGAGGTVFRVALDRAEVVEEPA